jgi:rhodanese-related sulfurtransferase
VLVIDVRERHEHEVARLEGAQLLPLSRFNEWATALDPEVEAVVMCHHGIRSAQVCAYLARQGFKKVSNLEGGIDRWSCEVDQNVPRY